MFRMTLLASTALLAACATTAPDPLVVPPPLESAAEVAPAPAPVDQAAELKKFFDDYDKAELALSPLSKAYRGIKDGDYGKLDGNTDADAIVSRELDQRTADAMAQRFDAAALRPEDKLSYDLLQYRNARAARSFDSATDWSMKVPLARMRLI